MSDAKRHPHDGGARHISKKGTVFIAQFEGFMSTAYRGPGEQYLTIGFGHYGADVKPGDTIGRSAALALLGKDCEVAAKAVRDDVTVHLSQTEFDALVSFTYNDGVGALSSSTLLKELNEHDRKDIPAQLMRWVHDSTGGVSAGLVRRRRAEGRLFSTGHYS